MSDEPKSDVAFLEQKHQKHIAQLEDKISNLEHALAVMIGEAQVCGRELRKLYSRGVHVACLPNEEEIEKARRLIYTGKWRRRR